MSSFSEGNLTEKFLTVLEVLQKKNFRTIFFSNSQKFDQRQRLVGSPNIIRHFSLVEKSNLYKKRLRK